jgi:hypothetical protein
MDDAEATQLRRENVYLKQRIAQLEGDLADIGAEAGRLRETLERTSARRAARPPNPLGGGQ